MKEIFIALVAGSWTETTPQDFMDGFYDPLLYVSRRLQVEGSNPADSGAIEFYARFDANRDGYYDLISASCAGFGVILWFGGPNGYSGANSRLFPAGSGGNCDMADLNLDGWPELIHSGWEMLECRIYWGSELTGGPNPGFYTSLGLNGNRSESVYVYDLDEDTYLDIILAGDYDTLYVFWGGPGGYSAGNCSKGNIKSGGHNTEVADLNKDGYPDIILKRENSGADAWGITIVWGDGDRNLNNNPQWFHEAVGPGWCSHGLTLGDFNRDGWLDVVVSQTDYTPGKSRVYFSDRGSFDASNMIILNTNESYGGSAAWDFNGDGWLDLLFFRGRADYPLLIYPNMGSPPYFRDQDTVAFGLIAGCTGGFIYDFNGDGKTDIFVNDWSHDSSVVYWGVQATGVYDSLQKLYIPADHHGGFRECGNVYDRSPTAWYESGVFSEPELQSGATISWVAWDSTEIGSELRMYLRTRWDGSSPWTDWREVSNGENVSEFPYFPARDIQYRAEFRWRNPAWLPWLERVNLVSLPLSAEESVSSEEGPLRFGSGKGTVWVSWPGKEALVSLYSADGRRVGLAQLNDGAAEFKGLRAGVYYIRVMAEKPLFEKTVILR
ncbi:MAG: VCBS repeat-containing protein [candidate division WOR-3 bacterium]